MLLASRMPRDRQTDQDADADCHCNHGKWPALSLSSEATHRVVAQLCGLATHRCCSTPEPIRHAAHCRGNHLANALRGESGICRCSTTSALQMAAECSQT